MTREEKLADACEQVQRAWSGDGVGMAEAVDACLLALAPVARPDPRELPITNEIEAFMHCAACLAELRRGAPGTEGHSPRTYAQLEIGFTEPGLQVWCRRHERNVAHIDFEGARHPANLAGDPGIQ